MKKGIIIKCDSGFYYVLESDKIYECKLRGKASKGYPGDWVTFEALSEDVGVIERIEDRKSILVRPPIANGDQLFIVMSLSVPKLDFQLLDRLIIIGKLSGLSVSLILNKADEGDSSLYEKINKVYRENLAFIQPVSAITGEGIEEITKALKGKLTILCGPSGVGKSSILNALDSKLLLKTGTLGDKIKRGRHTTRGTEFYQVAGGMIADTPGFSRLDFPFIEPKDLAQYYDDFQPYVNDCQFVSCLHHNEKTCGVKMALERKDIDQGRYERYLYFLNELERQKERRYK